MRSLNFFELANDRIKSTQLENVSGYVTSVKGGLVVAVIEGVHLGAICTLKSEGRGSDILCEVIGFDKGKTFLMPLTTIRGVFEGQKIIFSQTNKPFAVSNDFIGRVVDGSGKPLDGLGEVTGKVGIDPYSAPKKTFDRATISEVLSTGVHAIDGFVTLGRGQRSSIVAGSGVGKSTLFNKINSNCDSDVNVVALIGERGREAYEFVEELKNSGALEKTIVVVVTSDESPIMKIRGAFYASALAEYFCSQQKDVLLMIDSLTRFAMAQREIGLLLGEPPTSKGYPPSVYSLLPQLLERAGKFKNGGSITGLYTVLVEGDDINDPISDTVRSIVDGHIILTRELAELGHYPAIDILQSNSRLTSKICDSEHLEGTRLLRRLLAKFNSSKDLINIGAYVSGSDPEVDLAMRAVPLLEKFLIQVDSGESNYDSSRIEIAKMIRELQ